MAKRLQSALLLVAAVVPLIGAPTFAMAIDNKSADYFAHVADCLGWFFSDHDRYVASCIPSLIPPDQVEGVIGATANFTAPAPSSCGSSSSSSSSASCAV